MVHFIFIHIIDEACIFQNIFLTDIGINIYIYFFDTDKYYISANNANKRVTYLRDISL